MYGYEKAACSIDTPAKNLNQICEGPPSGLLNNLQSDLLHIGDIAAVARRELRELRQRTLGGWPENGGEGSAIGREPASKSEELANVVGMVRSLLIDIREQALALNQEI